MITFFFFFLFYLFYFCFFVFFFAGSDLMGLSYRPVTSSGVEAG